MHRFSFAITSVVFLFSAGAFAGADKSPEKSEEASWNARMQELKSVTEKLIPAVFSWSEFERVKDSKEYEKNIEAFSKLTHGLNKSSQVKKDGLPSGDPSLFFVSEMLKENAERALDAHRAGQQDYAKGLLKQSIGFCFSCHSTSRYGIRLEGEENEEFLKGLPALDKADYFVASRRFDEALKLYKQTLNNPKIANEMPTDWQRAVRNALALSVRVKNDPNLAKELLTVATNEKMKAPPMYVEHLNSWKKGVEQWRKDQKRFMDPGSEANHLKQLNWLATKAEKRKSFPADRSAEVEFLRLSASAHEFLVQYRESKNTAQVLYHLGNAYDALRGLGGQWLLQDAYWEACIFAKPNSKISWQCFQNYRDSIYRAYSGSRGDDVPTYLLFKLHQLKRFANHP